MPAAAAVQWSMDRPVQLLPRLLVVRPRMASVQQAPTTRQCGPGFLVIGAGRSGTSSLYRYLLSHPQVIGARQKQLQFWGAVFAAAADQERSLSRYISRGFPGCSCADRVCQLPQRGGVDAVTQSTRRSPSCAHGVVAGEASPSYLADPRVPQQLEQHMPGLKILVVLREPVERCFSSYRRNYLAHLATNVTPVRPFHLVLYETARADTVVCSCRFRLR